MYNVIFWPSPWTTFGFEAIELIKSQGSAFLEWEFTFPLATFVEFIPESIFVDSFRNI